MSKQNKPFVKITIEDLNLAKDFFENDTDYIQWLYAVTEYYQGNEIAIKKKIVRKYFNNYKKTMDFIIQAKEDGMSGYLKKVKNQEVKEETLEGLVKGVVQPNNKKENNKEEINKIDYEFYFNLFWNVYDKKLDRSKCFMKWKKIDHEQYNFIIDKAQEYVISTPNIKFRKNPLTWLNGSCWEDDIINNEITIKQINNEQFNSATTEIRKQFRGI